MHLPLPIPPLLMSAPPPAAMEPKARCINTCCWACWLMKFHDAADPVICGSSVVDASICSCFWRNRCCCCAASAMAVCFIVMVFTSRFLRKPWHTFSLAVWSSTSIQMSFSSRLRNRPDASLIDCTRSVAIFVFSRRLDMSYCSYLLAITSCRYLFPACAWFGLPRPSRTSEREGSSTASLYFSMFCSFLYRRWAHLRKLVRRHSPSVLIGKASYGMPKVINEYRHSWCVPR
mmetsp:Transcript_14756/g.40823  ORF Transcript_14756/g.40823 Transcript_14756/m.40823 type:complete len:232 (-) Transcript_14756:110-805(-)